MPKTQDILDISFDTVASEKSKLKILADMQEVLDFSKKVNGIKLEVGGNVSGLKATIEAMGKASQATNDYNKTIAENTKQQILNEKLRQQQIKTAKAEEDQIKRNTKAQEDANQAAKASADIPFTHNLNTDGTVKQPTVTSSAEAVNDLDKAQAAAANSATALGNAQQMGNVVSKNSVLVDKEVEAAKKALTKANSQQNVDLQGYKIQTAEATKAAKAQALEALGLVGAYKKLSDQTAAAKINAKDLAAEFGVGSKEAKEATATAVKFDEKLKAVDKSVGDYQRNVGNYSSAFGKAFNGLRTLANVLPGLGISGILLVAGEAIAKFASSFDAFKPKIDAAIESQKAYSDVIKGSAETVGKAKAEVAGLQEKIVLAKQGFIDKSEVLKEYNDTIGKTIGHANSLNEAETLLIEKAPAFIKFTYLKAQAQAAADLAGKEAAKSAEASVKSLADFVDTGDAAVSTVKSFFTQINPFASTGDKALAATINLTTAATKEQKKQITEAEFRYNKFIEFQKKALDDAAKIAKANNFDFYGGKETAKAKDIKVEKPVDFSKDIQKAREELIKAEAENDKISLQARQTALKAIAEDERENLASRIVAVQKLADIETQINDEEAKKQVKIQENKLKTIDKLNNQGGANAIVAKLNQIAQIETLDAKDQSISQKKLFAQKEILVEERKLLLEEPTLRQNIVNAHEAAANKDVEIEAAKFKRLREISEKALIKETTDETDNKTAKFLIEESQALTKLNDQFAAGSITLKKYKSEKEKITDSATIHGLEIEKQGVLDLIEVYNFFGEDTTKLQVKLAKLTDDIAEAKTKKQRDEGEKQYDDAKKLADKELKLAEKSFDLGVAFLDGKYEREKNQIQELMDLNDKRYDKEVENINNSTLSAQDKADKLIILDAQHAAQKDLLDKKQRDVALKQARFDRDAQALKIFGETLVQAGKAGFITPLALAIEAIGLVEIATLYAKPLPKFYKGKDKYNKYEGYAIVNDGGKGEPIQRANGVVEYDPTPKAKVIWLGKDDIVYPDVNSFIPANTNTTFMSRNEVNDLMYRTIYKQIATQANTSKPDPSVGILKNIDKGIHQLVRKKSPAPRPASNVPNWWGPYLYDMYKK